ncbi:hypothetical protein [Xenorhabdus vietnamensis]|uniref:hypothetical protein n=1 Tax=Xenorhabdus vietnamensis TaxID=351656 RepID=UPI00142DB568
MMARKINTVTQSRGKSLSFVKPVFVLIDLSQTQAAKLTGNGRAVALPEYNRLSD